jgi:hypothetical protein
LDGSQTIRRGSNYICEIANFNGSLSRAEIQFDRGNSVRNTKTRLVYVRGRRVGCAWLSGLQEGAEYLGSVHGSFGGLNSAEPFQTAGRPYVQASLENLSF